MDVARCVLKTDHDKKQKKKKSVPEHTLSLCFVQQYGQLAKKTINC